jgi:hypothetical protein
MGLFSCRVEHHQQFLAHEWEENLDVVMRQPHRAGEKLFVDYMPGKRSKSWTGPAVR